jgi:hypothetical protein
MHGSKKFENVLFPYFDINKYSQFHKEVQEEDIKNR